MASKTEANNCPTNRFENLLTKQDVECVIKKSIYSKVEILNYFIESHSSENLSLMGAHLNLIIEVSHGDSKVKETYTFFLKTFPYDTDAKAKFVENSGLFDKEAFFYNSIMPELMKSSKDKSWAPQCYLVKKDALVFENLKLKNYTTLNRKFLDVPSVKFALSSLAKMHAASLLAEKRLGKTFIDMYPSQLSNELLFSLKGPFREWYRSGIVITTKVAEKLGLNYKIVPEIYNLLLLKIQPSKIRRNVICHGDTWSNNFMFNGENCALVDFQLVRYVPPMVDVAQLIYFTAKKELRDEYEGELVKYYYESMCESLKSGGMDLPCFEDILDEYKEMKVVGIASINLYFPVQHIGEEKMKKMLNDSEGFQDLFCRDRLNLCLETMEKDERYKQMMMDLVKELLDLADTLFK